MERDILNDELYVAGGMYRKGRNVEFHLVCPTNSECPYVTKAASKEILRRLTMHHSHLYRLNFIGDGRIEATLVQKSYDCESKVAAPEFVELDDITKKAIWSIIETKSYIELRPSKERV
jgi:hypothetical protein